MAAGSLNIAIVGLGFGSAFVPIYQRHPDVGKVAICDADPSRLEEVGNEFKVSDRFLNLETVLADSRWDAVHLLTPVPSHAEQTLAALKAGKHCACAVPMATTLKDLERIIEAQRASGKSYMLMETAVFDRAYLYIKDLLAKGEMGDLTFLQGNYFQDLEGGYPLYWRAQPPMHYATHVLSPLLALAQTHAETVCCIGSGHLREDLQQPGGNRFPLQTAIFRLAGTDVAVQVNRSWFQVARGNTEAISVYGSKRSFEWQQIENEHPVLFTLESLKENERGRRSKAERIHVPFRTDLYPAELAEFKDGWHGGSHPHLVHAFVRSALEGRQSVVDAVTASNWTAAGICANDSSLLDGARINVPYYE